MAPQAQGFGVERGWDVVRQKAWAKAEPQVWAWKTLQPGLHPVTLAQEVAPEPGGILTDHCPWLRVETLLPILQQVVSIVWGGGLCRHHVPPHLVGGPHRHRHHPLPPALRDLQEAR